MSRFERADVQGLVVSGYGRMRMAGFLVLRIGDGVDDAERARAWTAALADRVTNSDKPEERRCINVAFTGAGLAKLGVGDADLATFPAALREGMAAPHRQRILGDEGPNHPDTWDWGGTDAPTANDVHALLLLYACDPETYATVVADESALLAAGGLAVVRHIEPLPLPGLERVGKFGVEHFGFADGMSQPVVRGSGQEDGLAGDDAKRTVIETGEFVLGYPNAYGKLTPWPTVRTATGSGQDFGRNASYLVVRQLAQDVAGFRRFLDENSRDADGTSNPAAQEFLGAKLVGRWPSGAPLVKAHHRDDPDLGTDNSFGYAAWDPHGERCPLGAHIRRTNPRDGLLDDPAKALVLSNLHRLVRRGRVYGPALAPGDDDGLERGLFFMCVNANLERQFEFVQHSWCNNPKFAGLYDEMDPLLGTQPYPDGGNFTIQDRPARRRVVGIPTFVTTRGGGYFFLPGLTALRQLGALGPNPR